MGTRWDEIADREMITVRKRIAQRGAMPLEKAAQGALIEVGHEYFVKAVLKGLIRSAKGKSVDTRAMMAFQRSMVDAGRFADPIKKLLAELGIDSLEHLRVVVTAYQRAERHTEEDRNEAAAQIIDQWLLTDHDVRERLARRWGMLPDEETNHA